MMIDLGKKRAWINSNLKMISFHKNNGWILYSEESVVRFWNKIYQMIREEGFIVK